jgi:hypothetical protein
MSPAASEFMTACKVSLLAVLGLLLTVLLVACSQEDRGTSVHCFDQQRSSATLTLPAFVQTNCPTIADTIQNSPPGAAVTQ